VLDDLRLAFRGLRRQPGFLVVALLTLGLAIGANVAVFTLVNAVLLRPMPFGDRSDRIVSVHATHGSQAEDWEDARLSYADLLDLRAAGVLDQAEGFLSRNFTLGDGTAERVMGVSVTPDLFALLDTRPAIGRAFTRDEAAPPGFESVVLITHGLWQRRFAGQPDIVGRSMQINGRALTIIGVMPQGFAFPERAELYVPLRWDTAPRTQRTIATVALLKRGQTLAQAQQEIDAFATRLARAHPATHDGWTMNVMTFRDVMVQTGDRRLIGTLLAAVAFVLLIGCANLAGLLLARGEARRREFAVRAALGARRWQIVRPKLMESLVLAALGTGLGALAAAWALELMPLAFADGLPYWVDLRPDVRVVLFTVFVMAFTAFLVGVAPGWRFSRPDVNDALKSATNSSTAAPGVHRLRSTLVVAQVALCVALLAAAVTMVRSFVALQHADAGFDTGRLLTFRAYMAGDAYDAAPARAAAFAAVISELKNSPAVEAAALSTSIPTDDGGFPLRIAREGAWIPGRELGARQVAASPELFETLGIQLDGRSFTNSEGENPRADVVIVARALADRLWPGESALDRRLGVVSDGGIEWRRVIGVAADVVYEEFGEETEQSRLIVYVPYARIASRTMAVLVRTGGAADQVVADVRTRLRTRFPGLPAYDMRTMAEVRTYTTWEQRVFSQLMAAFAGVALLLAWIGVYGLVAYTVARRTREIGVRMALGASQADVFRMMASDIGLLAVAGVGIGVALGALLMRALQSSTYGAASGDWRPLAVAGMAMALAMSAAAISPAYRAVRIQPAAALRYD
jgi:putative ABC transport system permease protein